MLDDVEQEGDIPTLAPAQVHQVDLVDAVRRRMVAPNTHGDEQHKLDQRYALKSRAHESIWSAKTGWLNFKPSRNR